MVNDSFAGEKYIHFPVSHNLPFISWHRVISSARARITAHDALQAIVHSLDASMFFYRLRTIHGATWYIATIAKWIFLFPVCAMIRRERTLVDVDKREQ